MNRKEQKTAAEIAEVLGTTKSAVLSAVARYGIEFLDHQTKRYRARPATQARNEAKRLAAAEKQERERATRAEAEAAWIAAKAIEDAERARVQKQPAWQPLPGKTAMPLWQVGAGCCWPCWATDDQPKLYCGEAIEDKRSPAPYCNTHMRIAYPAGRPRHIMAAA